MKKNSFHPHMKNQGFSLLEILISGFILALGLLGLAGMQSMAAKSSVEIQQRNLANSLVTDITERMKLNQLWLLDTGNNYAIASLNDYSAAAPTCVTDGSFTDCTGAQIMQNDLYEWKQKFTGAEINSSGNNGLIEADACIAVTELADSNGELVDIVISWFSTIESKDAAVDAEAGDLTSTCGTASTNRRQLSIQTYIGKSS